MRQDPNRPQISLEQLFSVKRAERPQPAFWQQFEREMRIKQLAAIVEPRPWWAPFIRIGSRIAKYQVPVGAAAILTLTLMTVREYNYYGPVDGQHEPMVVERKVDTMPGPAVAVAQATPAKQTMAADQETAERELVAPTAAQTVAMENAARSVSMLGVPAHADEAPSPAARMIAVNLEAVKSNSPELARLMERVSGMDALIAPTAKPAQVIDPLAKVSVTSENRRSSRLLASALPAVSYAAEGNADGAGSTVRLNRSLTEERLYDSISRFGFNADKVAIKF